jgi:hypothetical protein
LAAVLGVEGVRVLRVVLRSEKRQTWCEGLDFELRGGHGNWAWHGVDAESETWLNANFERKTYRVIAPAVHDLVCRVEELERP